ncbi:hypothetical protein [Echinimonas agarilytica]|uniref:Uncharacterized protein n=1 Tax=Echinimonas agarilytica TaxID=1215918 RepID=A0AA42BAH7_9GAMM|nr:hypothetical protein [Echinimonas agarilytica]MCM2681371.1 hypothetical protein [Echinimonas agarilytica]
MNKLVLLVIMSLVSISAFASPSWVHPALNASNSHWDKATGTLSITKSVSFGDDSIIDDFYWNIPSQVKTVLIKKNVTLNGHLRFTAEGVIAGEDWNTSIIEGTSTIGWAHGPNAKPEKATSCKSGPAGDDRVHDCEKWQYGAISVQPRASKKSIYTVKNLKILNARTYAITAINHTLDVDRVKIIHTRGDRDLRSNSDGFGGGINSRISNSYINTWDDSIKLYRDGMQVENVTIIHNGNGAPFQLGWSNKKPAKFTLKNVLVKRGTEKHRGGFNLALFSNTRGKVAPTIFISGLAADYTPDTKITHQGKNLSIPWVYIRSKSDSKVTLNIEPSSPFYLNLSAQHAGGGKLSVNGADSAQKGHYVNGSLEDVVGCGCTADSI